MVLIKHAIVKILETSMLTEKEKIFALAKIMSVLVNDAKFMTKHVFINIRDPSNDTINDLTTLAKKFIIDNDKNITRIEDELIGIKSFLNFMISLSFLAKKVEKDITLKEKTHTINILESFAIDD